MKKKKDLMEVMGKAIPKKYKASKQLRKKMIKTKHIM